MQMVGICSGYFQRFHSGHVEYIKNAVAMFDEVIIIINNDTQQQNKYKEFKSIRKVIEIKEQIKAQFPDVVFIESIDLDGTVCKTLEKIRNIYKKELLFFCKDGDRTAENIPETETLQMQKINFIQFNNKKTDSSTRIMKDEISCKFQSGML